MKRYLFFLLLSLCAVSRLQAQTFDKLFLQNATQEKYLIEQIIALKTYAGYARKGYNIIKDGNSLISSIKKNDLDMHDTFFNDRKKVKAIIRDSGKAKAIIRLQEATAHGCAQLTKIAGKSGMMTTSELEELKTITVNLMKDGERDADELHLVLTDGATDMSDDERILLIDQLYKNALKRNNYCIRLQQQTTELIAARKKKIKDMEQLRAIYK